MHGECILPEWLEAGIDPALRNSDEDASTLLPSAQSIASVAAPHPTGPTGITPIVLTPTSSAPVQNTKEDWRNLDKFYASDSEQSEPESGLSEEEDDHEDSGNNEGEQSNNDDEDGSDDESGEEVDRKSR